jgi:hypothetical protein
MHNHSVLDLKDRLNARSASKAPRDLRGRKI